MATIRRSTVLLNAKTRNGAFPLDWSIKFKDEALAMLLRDRGSDRGKALR